MKNFKFYKNFCIILMLILVIPSCEDYLDKAPEASISDKDAYGNFDSFQGAVEEMYNCVMDPDKGGAWNNYSFADENLGPNPYPFDQGNYWSNSTYFYGHSVSTTGLNSRNNRVWEYAWYAIRKANICLAKLDEEGLFQGTDEEYNLLKGQSLFFRGFFYFEICRYWGGMPYIKRALSPTENLFTDEFTRLSFQETAKLMAADFKAAAALLPDHWDNCVTGQATLGQNDQRINKFFALGYEGKALLYAGSPMPNEEATGTNGFDADLCKQAAEAFGELLNLADQTGIYKMKSFDERTDNFWGWNYERPGKGPQAECIMMPTIYDRGRVRWSTIGAKVPSSFGLNSGSAADVPTQNIVKNYTMANGLPCYEPDGVTVNAASGFDPNDPWTNREPRFYADIVIDGDRISSIKASEYYAQLSTGAYHRADIIPACATGYYCRKFAPMSKALTTSLVNKLQTYVPYLRLSDVYLMYSESVLEGYGTAQSKSTNYSMTAEQALNVVRNRAEIPDIASIYTADKESFFEEIVRERAVELLYEGARFCDLRRWNRNSDKRYLDKTAIDFDRGSDGKPTNISERVIITRPAGSKYNWLPIQVKYTQQYKGFPQNPGW